MKCLIRPCKRPADIAGYCWLHTTHIRLGPAPKPGTRLNPVVYVVGLVSEQEKAERHIKVGTTTVQPRARLCSLQNGCPFELEYLTVLPGKKQQEHIVHAALHDFWIRGEWFLLPRTTLHALLETLDSINKKETTH